MQSQTTTNRGLMMQIEHLDAGIVALLKRNARISVTQMSHELGVSRVTTDAHIKKMESSGVITGYTVTLGAEDSGTMCLAGS